MAINSLKLRFYQEGIIGSSFSFKLKNTSTNFETPSIVFQWVESPDDAREVEVMSGNPSFVGKETAEAFKTSFALYNSVDFTTEIVSYASETFLTINSLNPNITFKDIKSKFSLEIVSYDWIGYEIIRNSSELFILSGLESDNYLVNNEIWLDINSIVDIDTYKLSIVNLSNGEFTKPFSLYAYNNKSSVNIQSILKSLLLTNQSKFKISIKSYLSGNLVAEIHLYKNILRGGKRTEKTNISIRANALLRPSISLPVWNGYPYEEYVLSVDGTIKTQTPTNVDYRRDKGCDGLYFRFLNQLGGYSNWLFQSYQIKESNQNLGAYSNKRTIQDLGNESESDLSVYGKVPSEYYGIVEDLIVSSEIYILLDSEWVRVFSGRNSTERDKKKKAYSVKLKFSFENRFNPSVLWSN